MKTDYLLCCLLSLGVSSHPSKRQDSEEDVLEEWYLPALDWSDVNLEGHSVLGGHSAGEPLRRNAAACTGREKDGIAPRYELDTSSKAKALYEDGTDISVRQGGIRWSDHLTTAITAWGVIDRPNAFYDWAGGDGDSGADCVFGAIGTLLLFAAGAKKVYSAWAVLDQRLNENGMVIPGLVGGRAPMLPPGIGKRAPVLRVEDLLSRGLGTQVQHIGNWRRARSALRNRGDDSSDEVFEHAAFGLEVSGVPIHVARIYDANGTRILLGHGPGRKTGLNEHRLKERATQKYNNQYFDSDGLVMLSQLDHFSQSSPEMYADADNTEDYEFLVDQVRCYMTDTHPFATIHGGIIHRKSIMDATSLQFQMYNDYDNANLAAGEIAPLDGGISYMDHISIEGGLRVNPRCAMRR